jgi:hypothetical protein
MTWRREHQSRASKRIRWTEADPEAIDVSRPPRCRKRRGAFNIQQADLGNLHTLLDYPS